MDKRVVLFFAAIAIVFADDRLYFDEEHERRWNTPPELTPEQISNSEEQEAQARLFPLSASFSLSAGQSNAHSLSLGASEDGISLSQSSSLANSGGSSLSASQSTSFSAGLNGISAADANSFSLNHPIFGGNSQANGNSFSLGQANAAAHGSASNGQATSGAQSSVGTASSVASSGASSNTGNEPFPAGETLTINNHHPKRPHWTNVRPNHAHRGSGRPTLTISQSPGSWLEEERPIGRPKLEIDVEGKRWPNQQPEVHVTKWQPGIGEYPGTNHGSRRNNGCQNSGRPCRNQGGFVFPHGSQRPSRGWSQGQDSNARPNGWSGNVNQGQDILINAASASSSSSSGTNGFSVAQSNSQSNAGHRGPTSSTNNFVQTSGNAQGHAQGAAASVQQGFGGSTQGSFSSGAISGASNGQGQSFGTAVSGNRGGNSRGQVNTQTIGNGFIQGTANSGSVSFVRFPEEGQKQNIPSEFVRSKSTAKNDRKSKSHPIDEFLTDLTDAVAEVLDFS